MVFLYKCISLIVTEQMVNRINVFAANFKVLWMKVNKIENYEVTGIVINMQNTTIFEPIILTGFYTSAVNLLCKNKWIDFRLYKRSLHTCFYKSWQNKLLNSELQS